MERKKTKPGFGTGRQLPEPEWATELAEGDPTKAKALAKAIEDFEEFFGADAGDVVREQAKRIVGSALLRKVERDNPNWDGKTRVVG